MPKKIRITKIGEDLDFAVRERDCGGTWLIGTIAGHRFNALVFAEHSPFEDFELGDSRISKLWIRREEDRRVVFDFDRGLSIAAANQKAQAIVDFLCQELARRHFGN